MSVETIDVKMGTQCAVKTPACKLSPESAIGVTSASLEEAVGPVVRSKYFGKQNVSKAVKSKVQPSINPAVNIPLVKLADTESSLFATPTRSKVVIKLLSAAFKIIYTICGIK